MGLKKKLFIIFFIVFILSIIAFLGYKNCKIEYKKGVAVSKNIYASRAGAKILEQGGNAIDAAITVGYALGAIEFSGSGIGGGGFALIYLADSGETKAIDFRERAPQNINNVSYEFKDGPMAAGVPGTVAGFEYLREKYGSLPRQTIMAPAIELCKKGAPVSKKLNLSLTLRKDAIDKFYTNKEVIFPNGEVPKAGTIITRPYLAKTYELIAEKGAEEFYKGDLARKIVNETQKAGGILTLSDLFNYRVYEESPVCGVYRNNYKICSFPPPSSGGVCIIEALNILENFNLPELEITSPERNHYLIEALKYSFRDRALKLGDARFNDLPVQELISDKYAQNIANMIKARKGATPSEKIDIGKESPETTHFTVVDKHGNIASFTVSINGRMGSAFDIPNTGIIMNNTLDDFSLAGLTPNMFGLVGSKLNAPEPAKTPLSSMSPTIVYKNNKPVLALGSPGGPTIISGVLNTILAFTDHNMGINDAISVGRIHHQWQPDIVFAEKSIINEENEKILKEQYGHIFPEGNNHLWSHSYWFVQAVELDKTSKKLVGASDPRAQQGVVYEE